MLTSVHVYEERVSSKRTLALFVFLTLLLLALFVWQVRVAGWRGATIALALFCCFFLFYALNYRSLHIRLTPQELSLGFGLFSRAVPWSQIDGCFLDSTSLWHIGGAGIHFSSFGRRYRAMFNDLEHRRVLVRLREKKGLVWDIAFSTAQPEKVQEYIEAAVAARSETSHSGPQSLAMSETLHCKNVSSLPE